MKAPKGTLVRNSEWVRVKKGEALELLTDIEKGFGARGRAYVRCDHKGQWYIRAHRFRSPAHKMRKL